MSGLHQRIAYKRAEIESARATSNDPAASAQASHDAFEKLPRLDKELQDLFVSEGIGEGVATAIEQMIGALNKSPVKSAEMQLAVRDFETAGFRLRQHLGTKPD